MINAKYNPYILNTTISSFESPLALQYHVYNSLFLSLPFQSIEQTGTQLALFSQTVQRGLESGLTAVEIINGYFSEHFEKFSEEERNNLLFRFIQYVERQVVLFDSVEDALFEQLHPIEGPGSVHHLFTRLNTAKSREQLLEKLSSFSLRAVLTAHPTQFYPGKVLGIISDLGREIQNNRLDQIRLLLMQLGRTAFVNRQRPTPYDEAASLGWYLENIFYHSLPDIFFPLLKALDQDVTEFSNPRLLALGFWPGGDRDGNPFVTSEITSLVALRLREAVLRGYYRDLRLVRRRLTFRGAEEIMQQVERRVYHTLYVPTETDRYSTCQELLDNLREARRILINEHQGLFLEELDKFILKVRMFGFFFASLDIRQDSSRLREVWEQIFEHWGGEYADLLQKPEEQIISTLLAASRHIDENDYSDPFVKETIRSFSVIRQIQSENGEAGCHRYIISNCQSAFDVIGVLMLARLTLASGRQIPDPINPTLDIVPLFETIDDLAEAGEIMATLYSNEHYSRHLASRGMVQHIMLGFSDGTKDGGYFRANWSIYRAKEMLTAVSRQYAVEVQFFDGRGGPPGRGGGNNAAYYAAQGTTIANHGIQVTIQGQTVSSTYGTRPAAQYNLERLLTAALENDLFNTAQADLSESDRLLLDELAQLAYSSYLELKNHPAFVPYLERATPLMWYGQSNIGSRPTKRPGAEGTATSAGLSGLRAIPFVGAWAQMKQNVPGYYGLGFALKKLETEGRLHELQRLYRDSLFFRTLLENSMQSLSKSNFQVTLHLEKHPEFGEFWRILREEFNRTVSMLLLLSGQKELLPDNPTSRLSIAMRESIILPTIVIQQYALQVLESESLPEEQAEALRRMVLRAMFGIINAARNAA